MFGLWMMMLRSSVSNSAGIVFRAPKLLKHSAAPGDHHQRDPGAHGGLHPLAARVEDALVE